MNWVRIRCAFSALVLVLMAGAARGGVLYWMIDGNASDSFQFAYAQTLQKAKDTVQGANADSVVARAYAVDKSTGTRETYDPVVVEAVANDKGGTSFVGASVPETLPSTAASGDWIFGVEMGFMDGNTFTATYWAWDAQGLTYAQLNAMGAIQSSPTASYDGPVNAAEAPWTDNPHSVPEPTGGLLVVLGGAVLLLRRNGHA